MPSFLPGFEMFALAGAIAAAGPVLIHLMNRRRFRVVEWAAMDFLREAMQRNRKILRLRDLLLLILRTAVVLLFGLALARPFFSGSFSSP
ncbi:MAG: BatA domain-containing protein, partial [Planctomycetales bacterium]|nr:BatA domain-containing protein [Planctomycetales bacterium]